MNFEESLTRLEEITSKLESQDISLEDSLKMFEEGIKLSRFCEKKLTEAEQKLEILKAEDINQFSKDGNDPDLDDEIDISTHREKKNVKTGKHKEKKSEENSYLF
jgi:exodeoxyribonuclease VII small subunit